MKIKEGEIYKLTDFRNKWFGEQSDSLFHCLGRIKMESVEDVVNYGVWRFSYENELDIYCLVEGNNGYKGEDFAYRVYFFNQLGSGWCYIDPKDLEKL